MAARATVVITIGTEYQDLADLQQKYTVHPSNEPGSGLTRLAELLVRIAGGTEAGTVRVGVEDGDTGAGIFTDASVTVLRTYVKGV